jgi:hypothetical protein
MASVHLIIHNSNTDMLHINNTNCITVSSKRESNVSGELNVYSLRETSSGLLLKL